jgi:hypothetical protein
LAAMVPLISVLLPRLRGQLPVSPPRVLLLFRYGENSGDSRHAEPHARTSCHYQILLLNPLLSEVRLKRKDFPEVARLTWAQEVPSSNLGAPTIHSRVIHPISRRGGSGWGVGSVYEVAVILISLRLRKAGCIVRHCWLHA